VILIDPNNIGGTNCYDVLNKFQRDYGAGNISVGIREVNRTICVFVATKKYSYAWRRCREDPKGWHYHDDGGR